MNDGIDLVFHEREVIEDFAADRNGDPNQSMTNSTGSGRQHFGACRAIAALLKMLLAQPPQPFECWLGVAFQIQQAAVGELVRFAVGQVDPVDAAHVGLA